MKKLSNLQQDVLRLNGGKIMVSEKEAMTIRRGYVEALSLSRAIKGSEAVRGMMLAQTIYRTEEDTLMVEDQDAELLRRAIDETSFPLELRAALLTNIE